MRRRSASDSSGSRRSTAAAATGGSKPPRCASCGAFATPSTSGGPRTSPARSSERSSTSRPRTRRPASSASTSAARPPWLTRRSPHLPGATWRGCAPAPTRPACPRPAGGAVGAGHRARHANAPDAVCLDVGGTSCDVSVTLEGAVATAGEREVGGRPLALPVVDVQTVGAGGGSIAWRDAGGALRVGPHSAGADPGPACYGLAGEDPTVTDANLMLGRLDSDSPLAGGVELDRAAAERVLDRLRGELGLESIEETAAGVVRVAGTEMAAAVRVMTVERGIDPRGLALLAFGGAGPLHAAEIAGELGMGRIVVPSASGVLSALGMIVSERRRDLVESVLLTGEGFRREAVAEVVGRLARRGREELAAGATADSPEPELRASYDLRYRGQAFELTIPGEEEPEPRDLRRAFDAAHEERYGYADDSAELELVTVRVAVAEPGREPRAAARPEAEPTSTRRAHLGGEPVEATVHRGAVDRVEGPAVVELPEATLAVPPGWAGGADAEGTLVLEREEAG